MAISFLPKHSYSEYRAYSTEKKQNCWGVLRSQDLRTILLLNNCVTLGR